MVLENYSFCTVSHDTSAAIIMLLILPYSIFQTHNLYRTTVSCMQLYGNVPQENRHVIHRVLLILHTMEKLAKSYRGQQESDNTN